MSEPKTIDRQIRVEHLWNQLRSLAKRLWTSGLTEEGLHDTWRTNLSVACDACDTRLSEEDLIAVLDLPEGAEPTNPRLQKLAHGYCAKPGCSSRFYRLRIAAAEGIDWAALLDGPEVRSDQAESADAPDSKPSKGPLSNPKVRVALALVALVIAFLFRQWYMDGKIPFVTRKFQIAPVEQADPAGITPSSPGPPRTNGFKIAQ